MFPLNTLDYHVDTREREKFTVTMAKKVSHPSHAEAAESESVKTPLREEKKFGNCWPAKLKMATTH